MNYANKGCLINPPGITNTHISPRAQWFNWFVLLTAEPVKHIKHKINGGVGINCKLW